MKVVPETIIALLSVCIFLLLFFVIGLFLPRILRKKNKEKEDEDIQMNSLMGAFNVLGDEIKSLKSQLVIKERLAALGEVSAGIAHEMRNPMGVIAGNSRLLLNGFDEHDKRREIVLGIITEVEEMNCVIEELLKFSRSEPLNMNEIDLNGIIAEVINLLDQKEGRIKFSPDRNIFAKGDDILLKQAIKNLVQNALDSGTMVWITVEDVTSSGKEGVFVRIKDNGMGIPEADLNKVFMPFYTTKSKGMGIGLALVHKIVTAHGGSLNVKSVEGKGSEFAFFLPLK